MTAELPAPSHAERQAASDRATAQLDELFDTMVRIATSTNIEMVKSGDLSFGRRWAMLIAAETVCALLDKAPAEERKELIQDLWVHLARHHGVPSDDAAH